MKTYQTDIIKNYINSYNKFDVDGMIKNLDEDIIFENITEGKVQLRTEGLSEFEKQATLAKQYFTERKQSIDSWEFNDSEVIIKINYHAILAIDLPNGLKKGDTLNLKGSSKFQFESGKIMRIKDIS